MKIGLYFGTFNPIHIGHLAIANHLAEYTDLDEIWMVITPHNPHKKKSSLLADHHRYQLVQIATEHYPKIKPSKIEFGLSQPNYTVNTLAILCEKYPNHNFCLIMGEDNLATFHKWKNYEVILENHQIYVYPRIYNGKKKETQFDKHPHIHHVKAPIIEISSTAIRNGIATKKNVRALLPCDVWTYVDEMNFYK
ncbi:nicotinate (nicotinamide) nucleotide adenylyltransferase [Flavobacteriaceae bacterium F08102]|nr:nicotinate (nicotinamide) nucleotide adenylyltransferase [Flavobacteriaceae bacterium F08102]